MGKWGIKFTRKGLNPCYMLDSYDITYDHNKACRFTIAELPEMARLIVSEYPDVKNIEMYIIAKAI